MLPDVECHFRMMSVLVLDSVPSLKDVTNTCKSMRNSPTIAGFFSAMAESWKKLKTSNVFEVSSFIVCSK